MTLKDIEVKWQQAWKEKKAFKSKESKKKKFYVLEMYPYPSGSTLHMGHATNYTIGDVYARFKRMQGFNILHPMGFDSFGLPAENAAIKYQKHPSTFVNEAIKNYIDFMTKLGFTYDWDRMLYSHDPNFYKWNQWLFIQMLKNGLAYKKKALVNWCSKCKTVLANEQVIQGKCWRHENEQVITRELEQWFFKITDYADELLKGLEKLDWPEDIKQQQRNWIGKNQGTLVKFPLGNSKDSLEIFTTRIDTLFSVTFLVMAPEHPKALELVKGTKLEKQIKEFRDKVLIQDKFERTSEEKGKEGIFTGAYAINPATKEKIPIYLANFVLMDYGTGIVMANSHDKRDVEFAMKYKIPLKTVLKHADGSNLKPGEILEGFGILENSGEFNGLTSEKAIPKIQAWLAKNNAGKKTTQFRLRDWLLSRQRYWGTPIPVIYCSKCGTIPVPEKDLPVLLPEDVKFTGPGNPLVSSKSFLNVTCPVCNSPATRETDTMDTFVDSSWYLLRYTDPKDSELMLNKVKVKYWAPVDLYIGGREHATGHLIYSRFITKVLRDLKLISISEPAQKLFNQGMLHKDGVVMSKSKGNIVTPDEISDKYGIDTARLFLLSISSPEKDKEWSESGIQATFKTINKYLALLDKKTNVKSSPRLEHETNKAIKLVTENIENMKYNTACIALTDYVNYLFNNDVTKKSLEVLAKISSPFTPHIAEELYSKLGNKSFVSTSIWPKFIKTKIKEEFEAIELLESQVNSDIESIIKLLKVTPHEINLYVAENWKYPFYKKLKQELKVSRVPGILIKKLSLKNEETSKIILNAVKDESKLPLYVIPKLTETKALKELSYDLSKKFKCKVFVNDADKTSEVKAKKASPLKPAIVIL